MEKIKRMVKQNAGRNSRSRRFALNPMAILQHAKAAVPMSRSSRKAEKSQRTRPGCKPPENETFKRALYTADGLSDLRGVSRALELIVRTFVGSKGVAAIVRRAEALASCPPRYEAHPDTAPGTVR